MTIVDTAPIGSPLVVEWAETSFSIIFLVIVLDAKTGHELTGSSAIVREFRYRMRQTAGLVSAIITFLYVFVIKINYIQALIN